MKLLYTQGYYERELYMLEHNNKIIMVYRSSGLSGSGHNKKLLPFMYLNSHQTIRECLGLIFKEMLYNGKFISHHKQLENFDGLEQIMEMIDIELKDIQIEPCNDLINIEEVVQKINSDMHFIANHYKNVFFDYKLDFKKD